MGRTSPRAGDLMDARRAFPTRLRATAAVLVVALAALTACEDDAPADDAGVSPSASSGAVDAAALAGQTYESSSVEGRDLVEGTAVRLHLEDDTLSVSAGCNTHFGPFEVADGRIAWTGDPASSMMMCTDDLREQDDWLVGWFTEGVDATGDGSDLTLTDGTVTVLMADTAGQDLESLIGRQWDVVATIVRGRTSRLPVRTRRPWLAVGGDGNSRLFTGCSSGRTSVRVVDGQVAFGKANVARPVCRGAQRTVHDHVLAVVDDTTTDYVDVTESLMIVVVGDRGLMFRLR